MLPNFNIQKILIAPLDWGLGHATRCIPIIRALIANGYQVIAAAEGSQAHLLQTEFPSLIILPLTGYRVRYSKSKLGLAFTLLAQLPRLQRTIKQEYRWLDSVIDEHHIDLVISDNRYGLSSKKIPCIFITHQLTIKAPFVWLEKVLQGINYRYINQYNSCWVPDVAGDVNAAGVLSHPAILPSTKVHFIGLLSRFQLRTAEKKYDYCILLSGPEPQRTLLEEKLLAGFSSVQRKILLVRGKPGSNDVVHTSHHIEIKNHLPGDELQEAILQSEYIISRSGYTTVMELLSLQKKAILIPTPGQTEQEYLAKKLNADHICMSVEQDDFNCVEIIEKAKDFPYKIPRLKGFDGDAITDLLKASV
ncbi:MAG: UDP-N-acetylglucosamine-N-acetylmuramyl-(pentapeptide) pyrophosphoryl-undecaprenol [Sediminibacterium sp.]|nr:UDP-N-acetylglucosamine-N-acetylmuramyl-(pentapeptide) pyrophosphoryl-undecaprenol [Sediminibacterium sp.]